MPRQIDFTEQELLLISQRLDVDRNPQMIIALSKSANKSIVKSTKMKVKRQLRVFRNKRNGGIKGAEQ